MSTKKTSRTSAERLLMLDLHAPGMTLMHRAGLGGLAATLRAMERRHKHGLLGDDDLPAGPDLGEGYPWRIEPTQITLDWGEPSAAGEYFKRLFAFAFGIKDKLIDLPGTYRTDLSRAVRAELQLGLTLTFLQHGGVRKLDKQASVEFYNPDGVEGAQIGVEFKACSGYTHQNGATDLTTKAGKLSSKPLKVLGPLNPGAAVRHVAFGTTSITEPPQRILPLYFAMVGCLSLPINRGAGVLLVPEVTDLQGFTKVRPRMTPTSPRECRITGASDAALQAAARLRAAGFLARHSSGIAGIYAMHLAPQAWATQQKSRDYTVYVPPLGEDEQGENRLNKFEIALHHLPPHVRSKEVSHTTGRGKNKVTTKTTEWFWVDSVVRPATADNLAKGNRWYDRFITLMSNREQHTKLQYEKKGLQAMAYDSDLLDDEEMKFIHAMHRAIYMARGKIYQDTMGVAAAKAKQRADQATKKRWNRFMENLRRKLVDAKTDVQMQNAVTGVLGRTGTVKELRDTEAMRQIKSVIFGNDWQRVRNLGAYALASYKRPADKVALPDDPQDASEPDEEGMQLSDHEEQAT